MKQKRKKAILAVRIDPQMKSAYEDVCQKEQKSMSEDITDYIIKKVEGAKGN